MDGREHSQALAEWRERERSHRDRSEIDAARLERRERRRRRLYLEGDVKKLGRARALEAARSRGGQRYQRILGRSAGRPRQASDQPVAAPRARTTPLLRDLYATVESPARNLARIALLRTPVSR